MAEFGKTWESTAAPADSHPPLRVGDDDPQLIRAQPPLRLLRKSVVIAVSATVLTSVGLNLPIGFLITKTYMDTIPADILEAAHIDGCDFHATLARIVVPLIGPGVATAGSIK